MPPFNDVDKNWRATGFPKNYSKCLIIDCIKRFKHLQLKIFFPVFLSSRKGHADCVSSRPKTNLHFRMYSSADIFQQSIQKTPGKHLSNCYEQDDTKIILADRLFPPSWGTEAPDLHSVNKLYMAQSVCFCKVFNTSTGMPSRLGTYCDKLGW